MTVQVRSRLTVLAAASPLLVFLLAYTPSVGLGFISDDFRWISVSRITDLNDVARLFRTNTGFYRPIVSLTFAFDYAAFGLKPLGYGLTNLSLVLLCAGLIARLFNRIGFGWGAAAFGAAIWLLNFHGINMAVLWISGRTALLLIAASVAASLCLLSDRPVWAAICVGLALLSKEEAVALPVALLAWGAVMGMHRTPAGRKRLVILAAGSSAVLMLYLFLRAGAGAMTPSTAPSFYQFTAAPGVVVRNAGEYFDRACTFALGVAVAARLLAGRSVARPPIGRRIWALAAVWYACGYALTTFLPVRSSLYACLPSIAAALLSAAYCSSLWSAGSIAGRRRCLAAIAIVPLVCLPVYQARNRRWTDLSRFSSSVLHDLAPQLNSLPPASWLVLRDDERLERVNLQSAFGTLIPEALALTAGRPIRVWVEPPLPGAEGAGMIPPCGDCDRVTLAVPAPVDRLRR